MDDGHCGLPVEELVALAAELVDVPGELVRTALDLELAEGTVVAAAVAGTDCVFLAGLYRAERVIAERFLRIADGQRPWPDIDAGKALSWVEQRTGLSLAASQAEAVRLALTSKATVITGGPGVGKTTLVNAILRILAAKGVSMVLCAPTGRAAKRLSEATGFEARTIHRLLETDPRHGGFRRDGDNPLDCGLLVVDETSMVDVMLMQALLKAVPDTAALLVVGDVDQLPAVGAGQVLADIIALGSGSGRAPDRSLPPGSAEPDRQQCAPDQPGRHSRSVKARGRQRLLFRGGGGSANSGGADRRPGEDTHSAPLWARCGTRHPGAVPDEPRCRRRPLAQHGVAGGAQPGRRAQGRALRLDLCVRRQGDADRNTITTRRSTTAISATSRMSTRRLASWWRAFDGRAVVYSFGELDTLVPAYAATVHKSQGSEYPAVVIPVLDAALRHVTAQPAIHRRDARQNGWSCW